MPAKLMIIWDYDTGIGQINSTYPYLYREETIHQEIQNVEKILELAEAYRFPMTFAIAGVAAETGQYPYHIPDQIAKIAQAGHEVASHSWKHEWFPFLERKQIELSLERSKQSLERCLGQERAVFGFVPPFSRPMSWFARGVISLGDRVVPWAPGADLGSLLGFVSDAGYQWCRVTYRPIWQKLTRTTGVDFNRPWIRKGNVVCVPQHYVGFDTPAQVLLESAIQQNGALVICGHPSGLNRPHKEALEHLERFLEISVRYRDESRLTVATVSRHLDLSE